MLAHFPTYLALLLSRLNLVPLLGNLIINSLFLLLMSKIICKRFDKKFFFIKLGISYHFALYAAILAVIISFLSEIIRRENIINYSYYGTFSGFGAITGFKIDFLNSIFDCFGDSKLAAIYVDRYYSLFFVISGFVIACIIIFAANSIGCADFLNRSNPLKLRYKIILPAVLTLLNAPWLLFVSNSFLMLIGENDFYPFINI